MGFSKLGQSFTAMEIMGLVRDDLQRVEREINLESVAGEDAITAIAQYIHSSGGKRIRPTLLLLCCRLFSEPGDMAIRLAAIIEMIHSATLVHDDVIDVAATRRGRPSTNTVWGNHTSVLAGDWLYMQAFQMALRERNFHVLDLLIGLTQQMVEGELVQLDMLHKIDVTEADYMELVDRKTAGLFCVAAKLGAVAGGASEEDESRLGAYGWNLGIAFQLADDILDFTAREKVLGKPVGNDLREGKVTLPLIYALASATPEERALVETVLRDGNYETVPFGRVLTIVHRYHGIERAKERAQCFTEKARTLIGEFTESPYQRALNAITGLMTDRDY